LNALFSLPRLQNHELADAIATADMIKLHERLELLGSGEWAPSVASVHSLLDPYIV
jgi:hypothetical protein